MSFTARYLRKSRAERHDPDVLRHHRETLERLAEADGVMIPPAFCFEEVKSGERISKRPEFRALLEMIETLPRRSGGLLYVMDVDRLSRGTGSERGRIQDALIRADVKLRTPEGILDLSQVAQKMIYGVKGVFSEAENGMYRQRLRSTMLGRVRAGRVRRGRVPFGYQWDKNTQQPVPDGRNFEILKAMCQEVLTHSTGELGARYGLDRNHVRRILGSPMICGWPAECYRYDPDEDKLEKLTREQWIWPEKPGDYPAACTREEWEAIQVALAQRERGRAARGAVGGWCRDLVRFQGYEGRIGLGQVNGVPTYELFRPSGQRVYISRLLVHIAAEAALQRLLARPEAIRAAVASYAARCGEKRSSKSNEADQLAKDVERLRRMDEAALKRELAAEADGDQEELSRLCEARGDIRRDLQRAKAELEVLRRTQFAVTEIDAALPYLRAIEDWPAVWAGATDAERRLLARAFLEEISVKLEPAPFGFAWKREVTGVTYRVAWLAEGLGSVTSTL